MTGGTVARGPGTVAGQPSSSSAIPCLACGEARPYDPAEWRDAIVRVEGGQVELETADGARRRFGHGAVLWLAGLPVRVLRNPGLGQAR
ncbi:hypothetical protein Aros01_03353 [Streptosporangium roseum]|uniref:Uncharacterized protein n=2 Tax=Streptosporangium roseum TaxID=2001 RepID=D2B9K8_STRRD|nr:hypothetical protein Sros_1013 [Streptosporangium roseum DSM 43021]